jgi:hypothetical protein
MTFPRFASLFIKFLCIVLAACASDGALRQSFIVAEASGRCVASALVVAQQIPRDLRASWSGDSKRSQSGAKSLPCPRRGQLLLIACDALFLKRIAREGDWLIRFLPFPN